MSNTYIAYTVSKKEFPGCLVSIREHEVVNGKEEGTPTLFHIRKETVEEDLSQVLSYFGVDLFNEQIFPKIGKDVLPFQVFIFINLRTKQVHGDYKPDLKNVPTFAQVLYIVGITPYKTLLKKVEEEIEAYTKSVKESQALTARRILEGKAKVKEILLGATITKVSRERITFLSTSGEEVYIEIPRTASLPINWGGYMVRTSEIEE